jgi:hypothetical protein
MLREVIRNDEARSKAETILLELTVINQFSSEPAYVELEVDSIWGWGNKPPSNNKYCIYAGDMTWYVTAKSFRDLVAKKKCKGMHQWIRQIEGSK